jgi:DNA-binding NarL/FixJ family response regulator
MTASPEMAPPQTVSPSAAPAVILGGSEDTRLLLRGLLRLHRHRVLLETPSPEGLEGLPASPEPKVLILDAGPKTDNSWAELLASVLERRADFRALVILPASDPALESRARAAGAQAVLVRPFAIREFVEAVDSVGAVSE